MTKKLPILRGSLSELPVNGSALRGRLAAVAALVGVAVAATAFASSPRIATTEPALTPSPSVSLAPSPEPSGSKPPEDTGPGELSIWGSDAYPSAFLATDETLADVTDYWAIETVQEARPRDPETGLATGPITDGGPTFPIVVYLVSPEGQHYEVMRMPATASYTRDYSIVDWDPKAGFALMRLGGSGDTFLDLNLAEGTFTGSSIRASARLGTASNGRTYWVFTDGVGSMSIAGWDPTTPEHWVGTPNGVRPWPPLYPNETTEGWGPPLMLADRGEWVAYTPQDRSENSLEAVNQMTGDLVGFGGPGDDPSCAPHAWRDAVTLILACPDTEPGLFAVKAPAFDDPTPYEGFAFLSEELQTFGSAQVPGTPLVVTSYVGSGSIASVGVLTTDGLRTLGEFSPDDGYVLGTVRQPRTGVYLVGQPDTSSYPGTTIVVDVVTGRVQAYPIPADDLNGKILWSQLVFIDPEG